MPAGRVVAACAASLAVAGCAAVAVGMARAATRPASHSVALPSASGVPVRPAQLPMSSAAIGTPAGATPASTAPRSSVAASTASATLSAPAGRVSAGQPSSTPAPSAVRTAGTPALAPRQRPSPPAPPRPAAGSPLPLPYGTGDASRVITVTAPSTASTTATLQAWYRVSGGWRRYGGAVTAHVGADGLSSHPSEWRSATPIGSFTLTQAFGRYANPGTGLPYFQTSGADWWISQAGPLYNTHQHCWSSCSFTQGSPNEHLYYEMPYYGYAVVIDYNTRNAPGGVRQGAGSAFFLHVTDGSPTAGCVAIPQDNLVALMRWLTPAAHPRILIGVA